MPNYLTPARYRTLGSGMNLSGKTDAELASHIAAASAIVNSYTCVPVGHDFRGGTVVGEQHEWTPSTPRHNGSYRVWPYHRPLKTVEQLEIEITNNQRISFLEPNSLYVQKTEGWVEPVDLALTSFGVFGYGILPNIGLRTPVALVDYTYGWDFAAIDEPVAATSDYLQAQNQFWTDEEVILKKNGVEVDPGDYELDRVEGKIWPDDPIAIDDEFLITYHYPLPMEIARATALLTTEIIGASKIASAGLSGLSGIKVKEVELRQSRAGFIGTGMSPVAAMLLDPYVVRSIG